MSSALYLNIESVTMCVNGDIVGTATDGEGQTYRVFATLEDLEIGNLETLDITWITDEDHPLLTRWASLPAQPDPWSNYRAGAVTADEYCLSTLSLCLARKGYYTNDRRLDIKVFSQIRRFVLQFICPLSDQARPENRRLLEAFSNAWRQLAFEIRAARANA